MLRGGKQEENRGHGMEEERSERVGMATKNWAKTQASSNQGTNEPEESFLTSCWSSVRGHFLM